MADEIHVGSVAVGIVPDTRGLPEKLRQELVPSASRIGEEMGDSMTEGIRSHLDVGKVVADSEATGRARQAKAGDDAGGAFGDAFRKRLEAAMKALPKAKLDADSTPADRKLEEIRSQMEELSHKRIGVDLSDDEALAKLEELGVGLDALKREASSVNIRFDSAKALAELAPIHAEISRIKRDADGAGSGIFSRIRRSIGGAGGGGGSSIFSDVARLQRRQQRVRAQVGAGN